ncbi:MAG: molybdenum cofactor guanylyltransferase, partial [Spirochaetales bacterium]|nr:molybdenum cofactor guanylyltransferase [Spirochaetales bacterium]
GREKAFLEIDGKPLIQHIYLQLRTHFHRVIISANTIEKFAFLGAPVIRDKIPDSGPLMGIASAMEASKSEVNFVIACDIPEIDFLFVKKMVNSSPGYDGVVPLNSRSQPEPLFAVYKKSMLPGMYKVLDSEKKKISDVYKFCRIKYIKIEEINWLRNINTLQDYAEYIRTHPSFKKQKKK